MARFSFFPYFQTVGKQWNVCLKFCVSAAVMREFLEGKNLSFVLLLPSSIRGKSAQAGSSAILFFFNSNLSFVLAVKYLDSNMAMAVSQEVPLVILSVTFHSRLWGWGNQVRRNSLHSS